MSNSPKSGFHAGHSPGRNHTPPTGVQGTAGDTTQEAGDDQVTEGGLAVACAWIDWKLRFGCIL